MITTFYKVLIVVYILLNALIITIQSIDINSRNDIDKGNLSNDTYFHDNRSRDELQTDFNNHQKTYSFLAALKLAWIFLTVFIIANTFHNFD